MNVYIQVLALLLCPDLQNDPGFPQDAKTRAKQILNDMIGHTMGKYHIGFPIVVMAKIVMYVSTLYYHMRDQKHNIPNTDFQLMAQSNVSAPHIGKGDALS